MSAGLGYVAAGGRRGLEDLRQRALEDEDRRTEKEERERRNRFEDEDRKTAKEDRERRISLEDEDRVRTLEKDAQEVQQWGFEQTQNMRGEERLDQQAQIQQDTANWTERQRRYQGMLQQVEQERIQARNTFASVERAARANNDVKPLEDWYNRYVQDGNNIRIEQREDGYWSRSTGLEGGEDYFIGETLDEVVGFGRQLLDPELYHHVRETMENKRREAMLRQANLAENEDGSLYFVDPSEGTASPITDTGTGEPFKPSALGGRGGRGSGVTAQIQNVEHRAKAMGITQAEAYRLVDMSQREPPDTAIRGWFDAVMKATKDDLGEATLTTDQGMIEAKRLYGLAREVEVEDLTDDEIRAKYGVAGQ